VLAGWSQRLWSLLDKGWLRDGVGRLSYNDSSRFFDKEG